ncbi:hypothetical protein VP01_1079g2 [Puccinia sorghi]|uniref:Uncharacterized protein n=1 Tax=Puccinia sorghi TaxID=27349 RepID=A0A0L6VTN9_9BASI|nr:hypothetical protein VP01_1079g2 [Puccinia sorghi]
MMEIGSRYSKDMEGIQRRYKMRYNWDIVKQPPWKPILFIPLFGTFFELLLFFLDPHPSGYPFKNLLKTLTKPCPSLFSAFVAVICRGEEASGVLQIPFVVLIKPIHTKMGCGCFQKRLNPQRLLNHFRVCADFLDHTEDFITPAHDFGGCRTVSVQKNGVSTLISKNTKGNVSNKNGSFWCGRKSLPLGLNHIVSNFSNSSNKHSLSPLFASCKPERDSEYIRLGTLHTHNFTPPSSSAPELSLGDHSWHPHSKFHKRYKGSLCTFYGTFYAGVKNGPVYSSSYKVHKICRKMIKYISFSFRMFCMILESLGYFYYKKESKKWTRSRNYDI